MSKCHILHSIQVFLMSISHWKMPILIESHCNVSVYDFLFTKWIKVSNVSEDFTAGYLNVCWSKVLDTFSFYYSACKFFKLVRDVIKKFLVKLKRKKVSKTDFGSLLIGCSCGKTKIHWEYIQRCKIDCLRFMRARIHQCVTTKHKSGAVRTEINSSLTMLKVPWHYNNDVIL